MDDDMAKSRGNFTIRRSVMFQYFAPSKNRARKREQEGERAAAKALLFASYRVSIIPHATVHPL